MSEILNIFDPRRNFQTQGFTGRAATTTLHDATATGVSISGIFQAADDFSVLGLWNAYDYFAHLRVKHLPRTDLSGLKLEFDIEYDHTLDGCMRLGSNKYPSVSWDAVTFVTGKGDVHEVRLRDHSSVVSGSETSASVTLAISGTGSGDDWLHLYFRETRYTVVTVAGDTPTTVAAAFAAMISTSGTVAGRYGSDQSSVITAASSSGNLTISFVADSGSGKQGNLDRVMVSHGHPGGSQGIQWSAGSGNQSKFTGGDDNTKYHISLDFRTTLLDRLGATVPMSDCRKIYMVFAPRFEPVEPELETATLTSYGFSEDVEWRCNISNISVTGDASLKTGADAPRIEESNSACSYAGFWENYSLDAGWPTQWWSDGHAKRTAPSSISDIRRVTVKYSYPATHDLYLGTFLAGNCGKIQVKVDGSTVGTYDLYLDEYGGTTANIKVAGAVASGSHVVEITALFDKNTASSGWYFYFDYLWPLVPSDVTDAPQTYSDVSAAIDFDTDHGYKKPPAWHVWQLQKLGFLGHADVYMGVFWNNKRRRVGATYPHATIAFSGSPAAGDVVSLTLSGVTLNHAIGYGETLQDVVNHFRAAVNGMFSGVWANNAYGTSTTLTIQSKSPAWAFVGTSVSSASSVSLALTDNLSTAGLDGDWELDDTASPVMTEGCRNWIKDLAGQFLAASIPASYAFSMECYNPPAAMRARYLHLSAGTVSPGNEVYLPVPDYQMHFGTRVRQYLRQMFKECSDQIASAGAPIVLQFGETQWWYFDNVADDASGGMPFYDSETISDFAAAKGHQIWPFVRNTDDPSGDPAHPNETANFLRDRIWAYCQAVISYVQAAHPTAKFECLWPLDANQGSLSNVRRLNMYVNLPDEWKDSSHGIKYFRSEGFDYDVWQKNITLASQAMNYGVTVLGRPSSECMFLSGIYGPPDPLIVQSYNEFRKTRLYSFCFWALDQFCLNGRPVPLATVYGNRAISVEYHKPRVARPN